MKTKSLIYVFLLFPGLLLAQTNTQKVQGIECTGKVKYHANGALEVCRLAVSQTVSQLELPANTVVCFNEDQTLRFFFLEKPTRLHGHLCKGHGHDWMQCIYPNGQPRLFWLEEDEIIQGVPCAAASFWSDVTGGSAGVHFHENGKLAQCKLSKDFTYAGTDFKKGSHLKLDKNGNLISSKS